MIQSKLINRAEYSLEERENLSKSIWTDVDTPHVLLATCNRTEVYWGDGEIPDELANHLFRVASGLESSLIGERAIQGQIKQAYTAAQHQFKLSSSLNRLFQSAMHVGKRVRTETQIAEGAVSHSQVTADMLRKHDIDLENKVVGIIGVNKLTEDILKYLKARGALNIFLSSRNFDKASQIAADYGGEALRFENKRDLLSRSHVLICATSAPHTIVHVDDLAHDRQPEMILFDLAFPRDIEPAVGLLPGITLYNLDDIEGFARKNMSLRRHEITRAEAIIEEEMDLLRKWQQMKARLQK